MKSESISSTREIARTPLAVRVFSLHRQNRTGKDAGVAASCLCFLLLCGPPICAQSRAATSPPAGTASRDVTDETGRHVRLPSNVKRIVSLAPNLTEMVFALGKSNDLAGDTDFCDYPAEASQKPHVGGPIDPNLEQIVALKPDVILATAINRRETVAALDRLNLPVFLTDPHTVDDVILSVQHLGAALGAEKSAAAIVEQLRARLADVDRRVTGMAPRRVLFVVWTDPLISVGRDTFIADAMRRAGAQSVVMTQAEWPRISFEEIIRQQPDFLVFANAHDTVTQHDIDALRTRPGWRDLEALRAGHVVIVSDAINRPAPRMVDAVEQMARAFHPDAFSSLASLSRGRRTPISDSGAWPFKNLPVSGSAVGARFTVNVHRERHAVPLQLLDDFRLGRPSPIAEEACACVR